MFLDEGSMLLNNNKKKKALGLFRYQICFQPTLARSRGARVKAENEAGFGDYDGRTDAGLDVSWVFLCLRAQQVSICAGGSKKWLQKAALPLSYV